MKIIKLSKNQKELIGIVIFIISFPLGLFNNYVNNELIQYILNYTGILGLIISLTFIFNKDLLKITKLDKLKSNYQYYLIGTIIAFAVSFIIGAIIYLNGFLVFNEFRSFNMIYIIYLVILFIIQSLFEEILIRSLIFDFIRYRLGGVIAIILTSILFGVFHAGNSHFNLLAFINITLFALFAGVITYKQRNIYFASGFHFGWNFIQTLFLGVISGIEIDEAIFSSSLANNSLAGGEFGFEGSYLTTIIFIIILLITLKYKIKRESFTWIKSVPLAHRGYFNRENPENSLGAFQRAVDNNFGIELDIQLTKDDQVVVFHDHDLLRMCNVVKKVKQLYYNELKDYKLKDSVWSIPTFKEVLSLVDGKVPLIIELKNSKFAGKLESETYNLLKDYNGKFVVQSFNPFSVMWFTEHAPEFIRGQLSFAHKDSKSANKFTRFLLRHLLLNFLTQVDFIDIHIFYNNTRIRNLRKKMPKIGFTAQDKDTYIEKMKEFDNVIFDSFILDENTKAKYFTIR